MKSQFLIAAPMSGSGKTTVARGLMALLTEQGHTVQPFKCGPDYIDTKFHEAVCGRPSVNLDTFMATPEHVRALFEHYSEGADVSIVEGMMGLFDGYDRDRGSSEEVARVLDIPIVLVVDAKSAAYSMAALLTGFLHFRDDIRFAGVIFNKVGSERHLQMLQEVCDDLHISCLGYVKKNAQLEQDSRYLGLDFSQQTGRQELLDCFHSSLHLFPGWECFIPKVGTFHSQRGNILSATRGLRVAMARNSESFSFVYQETLDNLGKITYFDPEKDVPQLTDIDLLYLPGGYPEKHAEALAKNEACRQAIRDYAERGGRIVAECGGMMYLCQSIMTDEGEYPMCGVLPYNISARKADRKLSLGYRRFELDGKEYRGHEFHYSQFVGETPPSVTQVYDAMGRPVTTPVFKYKNVLASYTHLYPL